MNVWFKCQIQHTHIIYHIGNVVSLYSKRKKKKYINIYIDAFIENGADSVMLFQSCTSWLRELVCSNAGQVKRNTIYLKFHHFFPYTHVIALRSKQNGSLCENRKIRLIKYGRMERYVYLLIAVLVLYFGLGSLSPLPAIFQSVLLVEESGVPRENHAHAASHW